MLARLTSQAQSFADETMTEKSRHRPYMQGRSFHIDRSTLQA
jgi:hypothetical protein